MIPPDSDHALIARRWALVADRDIRSAKARLAGPDPIPEAAASHCQQAAEKLIKGLLVLARMPFRKTHDMEVLWDLIVPAFPVLTDLIKRMVPCPTGVVCIATQALKTNPSPLPPNCGWS